jgi:hypothetical protein
MKITLLPDPEKLASIREDDGAIKLAKELLRGFGLSITDCAHWYLPHEVDVVPNGIIQLEGMPCYLPNEFMEPSNLLWSISDKRFKEGRIILFNNISQKTKKNFFSKFLNYFYKRQKEYWFFAKLLNTGLVAKLPETILNLSCQGWPFETLDSSFESLIYLKSLDLSRSSFLSDVNELAKLKQLNILSLIGCTSLSDLSGLANLTQLTSLYLSNCESLNDLSGLANLTQLTSLNLSDCESLNDLSGLANLTQLTSLNLSNCKSLSDLSVLANLTQLTSLNLSNCKSLSDLSVLANLTQLTSLNLYKCSSLSDISPLGELTKLTGLNLLECRRITKFPNFKRLTQLRELDAETHPSARANIMAHCALLRKDWGFAKNNWWFNELNQAIQTSHAVAADLAISFAIGIPHLQDQASSSRLMQILHSGHAVSHVPWKHLFQGTVENSGFSSLVELTNELPHGEWTCGAIGGMCAMIPLLKANPERLAWAQQIILRAHQLHRAKPAYLRPIAAQWCLGLQEFGEQGLLAEWLDLFTDPGDSSTLDTIYLLFGRQALATGGVDTAMGFAFQIQGLLVRDELLQDLADHFLNDGQAAKAAELLFLLTESNSRSNLAIQLAEVPAFLNESCNLHKLLAASGSAGVAQRLLLGKVLEEKVVQNLPQEGFKELLAIECMKMVSRGLGISEAEAKQVLMQEIQEIL